MIMSSRREHFTVRAERDGRHDVRVPLQSVDDVARGKVANEHFTRSSGSAPREVIRIASPGRGEPAAIGTAGDVEDIVGCCVRDNVRSELSRQ